jgi:hypothetical protein
MYAQTMQTSTTTPTHSAFYNYIARGGWPFQLRHPEGWAAVHAVAAVWFIILATVLLSHGYDWGSLLYLVAAKSATFGYRLIKTSRSRQF